ncbi:MAG: cache domain-containing protein, partial [Myxococcota bacterium]|nr:cache domain-containing protein [Myxococcota bacterium]
RKRPWYVSGKNYDEPTCGNPYPDASGTVYLLPCNQAIRNATGQLIGVAGIDMALDEVINIMQDQKGYMLNAQLEIMLQSADEGQKLSSDEALKDNQEKTRILFQDELLLNELKREKSSGVVFNRSKRISYAYAKLQFAPWTLVLEISDDQRLQ